MSRDKIIEMAGLYKNNPDDTDSNGSDSNISLNKKASFDEGVTLAWDNLSVFINVKKKGRMDVKRIINCVTGAVKPGSLVAIMGASGAGKSTLLSALAYKSHGEFKFDGEIVVNGRHIGQYMRFLSGFMYQEDLFLPYLTAREHLNIMAHLKLDRRVDSTAKHRKIHDLLRKLGIWHCANSTIGGTDQDKALSGGEKKRLAFITELLTDPQLLFCDEPTTGLDSYSAQMLIKIMNSLAIEGKTVLCTIHQPTSEIFSMFSQLILLSEGRIAYMGPTNEAMQFFKQLGYVCPSTYNPADFYIKTLASTPGDEANSRRAVKRICDQFAVSEYAKDIEVLVQYEFHMGRAVVPRYFEVEKDFKGILLPAKLYWLTYRWFLETVRNPTLATAKLVQILIIAFIVGFCYFDIEVSTQTGIQAVQGILFMFVTENTFSPMYATLAEFPENKPLFIREYSAGLYNPSTYYLSKILALIPGFFLAPITFVVVAYWIAGLKSSVYAFFMTALITTLTLNVSSACGIMFSNAFESVSASLTYLVPFDFMLMITSGLFLKLNTLPSILNWTKYLSWLMYSTEALSIVQWEGVDNITCDISHQELPCIRNGSTVLTSYDFSPDHLSRNIISLFILLLSFYVIGYICLVCKIKKNI